MQSDSAAQSQDSTVPFVHPKAALLAGSCFTQLGGDSIAVIWTMVERHDPDSQWAAFWQSLPEMLHSGLSMSDTLLQALQGTSAHTECHSARQVRKHRHSQRHRVVVTSVSGQGQQRCCFLPHTCDC